MADNLFLFNNDILQLRTGFSEQEFAQGKLARLLNCEGVLVKTDANTKILCTPWKFSQTLSQDSMILLEGNFAAKKSFYTLILELQAKILEAQNNNIISQDLQNLWQEFLVAFQIIVGAIQINPLIPLCGPQGIILSETDEILFLPAEIIEKSLFKQTESIYADFFGCWINPQKKDLAAQNFFLATVSYFLFAGKMPYEQKNAEKRLQDQLDNNFVPLQYFVKLPDDLNNVIHTALSNQKNQNNTIEKTAFNNMLANILEKDEKKLQSKRAEFIKKQQKKLAFLRFVRKNKVALVISMLGIISTSFFLASIIHAQLQKPTTIGLSAFETVEIFYSAINQLDTDLLAATLHKKTGKNYINLVSMFFVTTRIRQGYEGKLPFSPIDQWNKIENPKAENIFGITNLFIDGKAASTSINYDKENTKKPLLIPHNAVQKISTSYYFFIPAGQEETDTTFNTEKITLTFIKNKWQITEITTASEKIDFAQMSEKEVTSLN